MIRVVNMQRLIQPKEFSPLEKINECKNKELYDLTVSFENIELVVISDYLSEIKSKAKVEAIIHLTNIYLMKMNALQVAYEKNNIQEFVENLTDESLDEYIEFFSEEKALVTEIGKEVQTKLLEERKRRIKPMKR